MLISIIIPYFNDEKYISRSVNSALAQTYKNTEIIIIDSEYSKNSKKILKSISAKSKKIKVILNKKSIKFPGIGRNIGIKEAKGELIAFLDSDDYWKKNKLEFQLKEMKKKNSDVIFTGFEAKNEKNKFLYRVKSPAIIDFELLLRSCPLCCSSVLIKKKCFRYFYNIFLHGDACNTNNYCKRVSYNILFDIYYKNFFFKRSIEIN